MRIRPSAATVNITKAKAKADGDSDDDKLLPKKIKNRFDILFLISFGELDGLHIDIDQFREV